MANSLCRLCSSNEQIVNVFHSHLESGEQLRLYILLATGIEIKESDVISKMVCHRCCEIAVKLHKYRTNAVANDKLLKEQYGQPYTPPITDQDELLRVASKICNETGNGIMLADGTTSRDALELLNISIKSEVVDEPCINASTTLLPVGEPVDRVVSDQSNSDIANVQQSCNNSVGLQATKISELKNNSSVVTPEPSGPQLSSGLNNCMGIVKNAVPTLQPHKITPRICYVHPSVKQILKKDKNLILPTEAFKSDISPVVSLDSAEVSDWYATQLNLLKRRWSNIIIKKIPDSTNWISVPSGELCESNTETNNQVLDHSKSYEDNITSKSQKPRKRNYRRILDSSDYDSDSTGRDQYQPFNPPSECINAMVDSPAKLVNSTVINVSQANYKQVPRARKRTSRKVHSTRKKLPSRESDTSEVIPQKKKRIYSNKDALCALNKMDLPRQRPTNKIEQKAIFTSSLELTPIEPLPDQVDCQNMMTTGKTLDIFMCPVCSALCISKKELIEHEKSHLTCKYCKTKIRNIELMKQHLNNTCFISLVKDNAVVKLTRVDSLSWVVKKYPEAFQDVDISTPSLGLYCNENRDDFREFGINIEETEPAVVSGDLGDNVGQIFVDQNAELIQVATLKEKNINKSAATITNNTQKKDSMEVVCISDSDDEIECTIIPRHKIVEPPKDETIAPLAPQVQNKTVDSTTHVQSKSVPVFPPLQMNLTEKEMIRSLFKKYSNSTKKCDNSAQTFTPLNTNIKYTNTNLIILENMFTELLSYKIPVQLESQPEISARFKNGIPTRETATLECWVHKTPIDVIKSSTAPVVVTNSLTPNSVAPTKALTPNSVAPTKALATKAALPVRVTAPKTTSSTTAAGAALKEHLTNVIASTPSLVPSTVVSTKTRTSYASNTTVSRRLKIINASMSTNTVGTKIVKQTKPLPNNAAIPNTFNSTGATSGLFSSIPLFTDSLFTNQGNKGKIRCPNVTLTSALPTFNMSAVPASLANSNNLLVPTTAQSSVNVAVAAATPEYVSNNSGNQVQSANFMQIVEKPRNGGIQFQNNGNTSYGIANQAQSSNLMQILESPTTLIQYAPVCVPQNNVTATERQNDHVYHQSEPVYHINNNVTNVNKIIVLSNNTQTPILSNSGPQTSVLSNMQQAAIQTSNSVLSNMQQAAIQTSNSVLPNMQQAAIQTSNSVLSNMQQAAIQTSNAMYTTSYLNTVTVQSPPSYEQSLQFREIDQRNPETSLVMNNRSAWSAQNRSIIRVKNLSELTP